MNLRIASSRRIVTVGLLSGLLLALGGNSRAMANSWTAAAGGDWNTAANWSPDVPDTTGENATFNTASAKAVTFGAAVGGGSGFNGIVVTGAQTGALTITSTVAATNFRFGNGTASVTAININSGAGAFSLGASGSTMQLVLGGTSGTYTFQNDSANTATLGSQITQIVGGGGTTPTVAFTGTGNWVVDTIIVNQVGATPVTKAGNGTLTLTGANTYTGNTTVSGGTLLISGTGKLADSVTAGQTLSVGSGATVSYTSSTNNGLGNRQGAGSTWTVAGAINTNSIAANSLPATITLTGGTLSSAQAGTNGGTFGSFYNYQNTVITATGNSFITGTGTGNFGLGTGNLTLSPTGSGDTITASIIFSQGAGQAGGIIKSGLGTVTLSGANTYTGGTTINSGTLKAGSTAALSSGSTFTVTSPGTLDLAGFNNTIAGLSASTGTITDSSAAGSGGILRVTNSLTTITGLVTGSVGVQYQNTNGSGGFSSNNSNTYSGGTYLGIGTSSARYTPAASATIGNGVGGALTQGVFGIGPIYIGRATTDQGQIFMPNASVTINNPITFNSIIGTDVVGGVRVDNATGETLAGVQTAGLSAISYGSYSTNGTVTVTGQLTGSGTFTGTISNTGLNLGGGTVISTNAGLVVGASNNNTTTVILSNAAANNNYTGDTWITAKGVLQLGSANQIPNGATAGNVNVATSGALNLAGFSEQINGLSGAGTVDGTSGSPTLTVGDNNATSTFSGVIKNTAGNLALVKSGGGTLTLSGANSYTGGTTISAGTISVGNASAFGGSAVGNGAIIIDASGTVITGSAFNLQAGNRPDIPTTTDMVVNGNAAFANNMTILNTSSTAGFSLGGTGTLTYTGAMTAYTGMMGLSSSVNLVLGTGGSITLNTGGNSLLWMTGTSSLTLNGGSFSAAGNNGSNAGFLNNVTMTSGSASFGGASTTQVSLNSGAVIALNGGTFSVQGFTGAATNTINFNGGTLKALASNASFLPSPIATKVQAGGIVFDSNTFSPTIGALLAHDAALGATPDGGLTKSSTGTLTLTGANSYTGVTTINGGTISVSTLANGGLASGIGASPSPAANLILFNGTLQYTGGATSTDRLFRLGGNAGGGATTIEASGSGALNFTNTGALGGDGAVGARSLTLTGTNTGANTLTPNINDYGAGVVSLTKSAAGTWTVSGTNSYTGATTISGGTLKLGSSTAFNNTSALTMSGTATLDLNNFDGAVTSTATAGTNLITNSSGSTKTLAMGTVAAGLGNQFTGNLALTVSNSNGAFLLSNGANTFSGGLTLLNTASGTRMAVGTITAGAYGTGPITIGLVNTDKAGIYFATAGQTLTNDIIFNTDLGTDRFGIRSDVTGTVLSGTITANNSNASFGSNTTGAGGFISLNGKVTGTKGVVTDVSNGQANTLLTVTLNNAAGTNDYAGDTIINRSAAAGLSSKIVLGANNQIPNGAGKGNVIINTSGTGVGTLDLNGKTETINGLSGSGTVDGTSGTPTLTVGDNNATSTFSGIIKNTAGSLALTKIGSGTQTFSGANTYTGTTTISGGTLALSTATTNNIASSTIINTTGGTLDVTGVTGVGGFKLASGQTLKGTGTVVGALTVGTGSTIAPGNSPGTINTGATTYASGGAYQWEINNVTGTQGADPGWDFQSITGVLDVTATSGAFPANTYRIDITGLNGGAAGAVANWNPHNTTTWNIATASGGITNFAANKFFVDTTNFDTNNNRSGGTFTIGASGNNLQLTFNGVATATAYWDINGATAGAGGGAAPFGNWSSSNTNWTFDPAGTTATTYGWTPGDDAVFSAGSTATGTYTANITQVGGVTAHNITVKNGAVTISGGTLTLAGTTPTIAANTGTNVVAGTTISAPIAGSGWTNAGTGRLTLTGANTYSGTVTLTDGYLELAGTSGNTITGNVSNQGWIAISNANQQFNANTVMDFPTTGTPAGLKFGVLELDGFNQTLRGLQGGGNPGSGNWGYVEAQQSFGSALASTLTIQTQSGDSFTYAGVVRNQGATFSLTKAGLGTQTLSGANISYTGATAIQGGTLVLSAGAASFASTSYNISSGATLEINATGGNLGATAANVNFTGTGKLLKTGTGLFFIPANAGSFTLGAGSLIDVQAGTFDAGSSANETWSGNLSSLNVNNGATISELAYLPAVFDALTGGGSVSLDAGAGAGPHTFTIGANNTAAGLYNTAGTATFSGIISQGGTVIKTGTGTQILSGLNTYTGATTIQNGTLSINTIKNFSANSAIGAPASGVITMGNAATTGTLIYTGTGDTSNRTIQIGVGTTAGDTGGATIQNDGSGALTFNATNFNTAEATGTATRTLTLRGSNTGANTISGIIQDNVASTKKVALIKTDSGTWNLTGINTYTGGTTVNQGTLTLGAGGSTGNIRGTLTINNSGSTVNAPFWALGWGGPSVDVDTINISGGTLNFTGTGGGNGGGISASSVTMTGGVISSTATTPIFDWYDGNTNSPTLNTLATSTSATISGGMFLRLGTGTLTMNVATGTVPGGVDLLVSGAIQQGNNDAGGAADTTSIKKTGTGTALFSGVNTYAGNTIITQGTLRVGASSAIPNGSGKGNVVFDTAANTAVLDINGFDTTINGLSQASASATNKVVNNAPSTTKTLNVGNNDQTSTFAGIIADNTGVGGVLALTKSGTGSLTLSGANTYTGATLVSVGELVAGNNAAFGASAGGVDVTSGARVVLNNGISITGESITIAGVSTDFNGALQAAAAATASWGGTVTLNSADARIGTGIGGTLTVSGGILGSGANQSLFIGAGNGGTGTVILSAASGASTYSGSTNIIRGTLKVGANNSLPTGTTLDVDNSSAAENATFDLNNFDQTIGALQRTDAGGGTGGSFVTNSGGAIHTLTVNQAVNTSYSGVISGNLALTKGLAGTLTLNGTNTFTGNTAINLGTLAIGSTGSLGSGTYNGAISITGKLLFTTSTGQNLNGTLTGAGTIEHDGSNFLYMTGTMTGFTGTFLNTTGNTFFAVASGAGPAGSKLQVNSGAVYLGANGAGAGTWEFGELSGTGGFVNSAQSSAAGQHTLKVGALNTSTTYAGVLRNVADASSGTLGLTKTGSGTLTLTGTNTYTGSTAIDQGTLTIGTAGSLGSGSYNGAISTTGKLLFTTSTGQNLNGTLTGAGTIEHDGSNFLYMTGTMTGFTGTFLNTTGNTFFAVASGAGPAGSKLQVNSGAVYLGANGAGAGTWEFGELSGTGGFVNSAQSSAAGQHTLKVGALNTSTTYAGVLRNVADASSGTLGLTKVGSGTLTLTGAHTYTGATLVSEGTLELNRTVAGQSLSSSSAITIDNATMRLTGTQFNVLANNALIIQNGGILTADSTANNAHNVGGATGITLSGGTMTSTGANDAGFGNFVIGTGGVNVIGTAQSTINASSIGWNGTRTFTVANATAGTDLLVSSVVKNSSGTAALTKSGAGTLELTGANTYTGATTVNAGVLSVASLANGNSNSNIGASSSAAANLVLGGGTLQYTGGSVAIDRAFTLTAATSSSIDVTTAGANLTISGAGASTSGALTKTGAGTLTLTGASTYSGATTVSQGTLVVGVGGVGSINNSAVTVLSGAMLAGSGSSGAVTINAGATHKPGNSPGIFTVGGIYTENGDLNLEFFGTGAAGTPGGYSQVHVTATGAGSVALGGSSTLSINYTGGSGNFNPTFAQVFTLIDHDGNTSADTTGMFSNYNAEGSNVIIDGKTLKIFYHDGGSPDQNNVVLVATGTATGTLYVNNEWTSPATVNGDLETGSPAAFVGVNAFATPTDLLAAQPAFAGNVVLNGGTYASAALAGGGGVQLQLVNDTVNGQPDVTIAALSGDANDSIATRFHNVAGVGDLTVQSGSFSGQISGGGDLTKTTGATLILDGTNTYSGVTTISGGTLQIGSGSTTGTLGTGNVVDDAALVFNRSNTYAVANAISGTGTVDQVGSGTTLFSGANTNTYTGVTTVSSGTLELARTGGGNKSIAGDGVAATADLVISGGNVLISASEQIADNARVNLSSGSFMFNGTGLTETIGSFTNTGGVFSTNGANTLIGTGNTITWAGGTNTITSGGLVQDNNWVISGGTNTVQGGPAGTLQVQTGGTGLHFSGTGTHGVTLNSDAASPGRILLQNDVFVDNAGLTGTAQILSGGSAAVPGTVDMDGGTRTFDVINGTAAVDMLISARLANGALTKTGAGTLRLTGDNTYTGATTVNTGTLQLVDPGVLQNGSVAVNGGAFQQTGGTNNVTGGAGVGDMVLNGGTYSLSGGALDFHDYDGTVGGGPAWVPNNASTLQMNNGLDFSFTGGSLFDVSLIDTNGTTFTQGGGQLFVGRDESNNSPAQSAAALTELDNNFTQLAGIIELDIFGEDLTPEDCCDAGQNDALLVQGTATLGSTTRLHFVDFDPEFGDIFNLMCADAIVLQPGFGIDGGFFRVVPTGNADHPFALQAIVPEPASVAVWTLVGLAGAAGAAGAWRLRRKNMGSAKSKG